MSLNNNFPKIFNLRFHSPFYIEEKGNDLQVCFPCDKSPSLRASGFSPASLPLLHWGYPGQDDIRGRIVCLLSCCVAVLHPTQQIDLPHCQLSEQNWNKREWGRSLKADPGPRLENVHTFHSDTRAVARTFPEKVSSAKVSLQHHIQQTFLP